MVIKSNTKKLRLNLWLIVPLSLLGLAVVLFTLQETHVIHSSSKPAPYQSAPVDNINSSPPASSDSDIANQVKQNSSTTPTPQDFQVTLTQVTQDPFNRDLIVRSLVQGISTGSCTLDLVKNGTTVLSKQADVFVMNEYATCSGFAIPLSEISTSGEITLRLIITNNSTSKSDSQNIVLEQ
jgi:hypothetical protein